MDFSHLSGFHWLTRVIVGKHWESALCIIWDLKHTSWCFLNLVSVCTCLSKWNLHVTWSLSLSLHVYAESADTHLVIWVVWVFHTYCTLFACSEYPEFYLHALPADPNILILWLLTHLSPILFVLYLQSWYTVICREICECHLSITCRSWAHKGMWFFFSVLHLNSRLCRNTSCFKKTIHSCSSTAPSVVTCAYDSN